MKPFVLAPVLFKRMCPSTFRLHCLVRCVFATLVLLMLSSVARAGFWTATYVVEGVPYDSPSGYGTYTGSGGSTNVNLNKRVEVYFVWNSPGSPSQDRPDTKLVALIDASALASSFDNNFDSVSVSNGFASDPVSVQGNIKGVSGRHLIQKNNPDRKARVYIGGYSLSATTLNGVAYLLLNAKPDTRLVGVYCREIEDGGNFRKGPNNQPVLNVPDEDGNMKVDTVGIPQFNLRDSGGNPIYCSDLGHWADSKILQVNLFGFSEVANGTDADHIDYTETEVTWEKHYGRQPLQLVRRFNTPISKYREAVASDFPRLTDPRYFAVRVTAKDLRERLEAEANTHYEIAFHPALENIVKVGSAVLYKREAFPSSAPVHKNEQAYPIQKVVKPAEFRFDWYNDTASFISGGIGSGSVVYIAALLLNPEASVTAMILAACDIAANYVGWIIQQSGTPDPTLTSTETANEAAFQKAMSEQARVNANDMTLDFPTETRVWPADMYDLVRNNTYAWFNLLITARCHWGRPFYSQLYEADHYNVHGYEGRGRYTQTWTEGLTDIVWQFTIDGALTVDSPPGRR